MKFEEHEARNEDDLAMTEEKIKKIKEQLVEHRSNHDNHNQKQN